MTPGRRSSARIVAPSGLARGAGSGDAAGFRACSGMRRGPTRAVLISRDRLDYFGRRRNIEVVGPEEIDELLRALAHPARRDLLRLCRTEPQPAGALTS